VICKFIISERIKQEFEEHIQEIQETEQKWEKKTTDVIQICQLLESIETLQKNPKLLFEKCPNIVHKLDQIDQPIQPTNLKFINSVNLNTNSKPQISFEELKNSLKSFIDFTDYKVIQYFK
jgi:hypothetical protein